MAPDLLEQLARAEVPPPPASFDKQLHEKVNRTLLFTQMFDLLVAALPWACLHFGRAILGALAFSVTGRYEPKSKERRR